jgi:hypothetical protein
MDNIDFNLLWNQKCNMYDKKRYNDILPLVNRIIVIGDIHGDLNMLLTSLKIGNLINDDNEWIGKDTVVVQLGDQIDRCRSLNNSCENKDETINDENNDIKILLYMTELHKQAEKYGGAVYSLLGNHELMNINGDLRYVSYLGLTDNLKNIKNINNIKEETIKINYGKLLRKQIFKRGEELSNFLACTRRTILIIGDYIFVHGGIVSRIAEKYENISDINKIMSLYLWNELKDITNHNILFNSYDSPLWTREIGNLGLNKYIDDETCDNILFPLKKIYNVGKIFVGHTPMLKDGIKGVCKKNVWLTDYGGSQAFDKYKITNNKIQILEILNELDKNNNRINEKINILK